MHQIVVLLSLGFLAVWTIGPFAFFIVYHVPSLRRLFGLDASIKWAKQAREHFEKLERDARRPQEDAGMVCSDVDGRNAQILHDLDYVEQLLHLSPNFLVHRDSVFAVSESYRIVGRLMRWDFSQVIPGQSPVVGSLTW